MLSINRPLLINSKFDSDVATAEPTIDTLEAFCRDTVRLSLLLLASSSSYYTGIHRSTVLPSFSHVL